MNLIEEGFEKKEEKKKNIATKIILVAIILLAIAIIAIGIYLIYLKSTLMTITIDGKTNQQLKDLLIFKNDGTIYAPIKKVATYFGYESFSGEYSDKSEDQSKCYVSNENEVANFELGEKKIYKLDLTQTNSDYEYVYANQPVIADGGELYATTEALEKAFNISFEYDKEKNTITIWTLPELYAHYSQNVLDYGYTELSNVFVNQKAILNDKLIVVNSKKQYGVIGVDGKAILEAKYDNITYLLNTGDFLVETNKKVGIISSSKETKVPIQYDSIELMDSDKSLYIAKQDNKYGVIDSNGNPKIYIDNDEIGIDISKFSKNNIKNKYLLAESLIPVRKDKYWALYDTNGKQITEYKYDSLGYIASNNKEAINLLVIPNYNVLVVCKDKKYTLINTEGKELFGIIADDIYMTISGGETHYYIIANDNQYNAEEFLKSLGVKATESNKDKQSENKNENSENKENTSTNSNKKDSKQTNTDDKEKNNNNSNKDEEDDNNNNSNNRNNEEDSNDDRDSNKE